VKCRELASRLGAVGAAPGALLETEPRLPALDDNEVLLSFFLDGEGRLQRFLARRGEVRVLAPLASARIEALTARVRDELELGDDLRGRELFPLLARLRRELFAGVELARARRLLILPDGLLRALPFAALGGGPGPDAGSPRPEAGAPRFLVTELAIAVAPCLALYRPSRSPARVEIFLPSYGGPSGELRGPPVEAGAIARAFPVRRHEGVRATALALAGELARATPTTAIHFAGHGLTDLDATRAPASLLLFPDGANLTAADATRRPTVAPLVVLASCTTGYAARFRDGERRLASPNLAEALLAAGARRVVAASFAVKDHQSAEQLRSFYRELARRGAAEALAYAQREAIGWIRPPHPRFWAFYAVYGGF
jgi:CHAT domain-containing protein